MVRTPGRGFGLIVATMLRDVWAAVRVVAVVAAGGFVAGCPVAASFEGSFFPDSNVTWQDAKLSEIKGIFENGITTITASEKASGSASASTAASTESVKPAGRRSLKLTIAGRLEAGKTYELPGPVCATCSAPPAQMAFLEEPGKEWAASGSMTVASIGWPNVELGLEDVQMLPVPGSAAQGSFRMDMKIRLPMP